MLRVKAVRAVVTTSLLGDRDFFATIFACEGFVDNVEFTGFKH